MPFELQVIHASDFIQTNPHGHFDLAASKAILATLARACRKRGINQALVDLRALRPGPKPVFTTADLAELVNTFGEVGFTQGQRLAILYRSDPHRRARLFAFLSTVHGWSVKAFGDFETAILWLSHGPEEVKPQRAPGEQEIPISFRRPNRKRQAPRSSVKEGIRKRTARSRESTSAASRSPS